MYNDMEIQCVYLYTSDAINIIFLNQAFVKLRCLNIRLSKTVILNIDNCVISINLTLQKTFYSKISNICACTKILAMLIFTYISRSLASRSLSREYDIYEHYVH